jgi:hypothetical protein
MFWRDIEPEVRLLYAICVQAREDYNISNLVTEVDDLDEEDQQEAVIDGKAWLDEWLPIIMGHEFIEDGFESFYWEEQGEREEYLTSTRHTLDNLIYQV